MEIIGKEIIAAEGKYIHRINSDVYFRRCTLLQGEGLEHFEEVDSVPEIPEEDVSLKAATTEKVNAMFMAAAVPTMINTFSLSAKETLSVKEMFPVWSADGLSVKQGERYQCDNLLWECIKAHTTQADWKPGIDTASLWKVVELEHEGTKEDPIPYTPPMEIFEGKYYSQGGVKYKCTRDSQIPLSHDLSALVGTYVELIG